MPDLTITSCAEPDPRDAQAIFAGLRAYNEAHAGPPRLRMVNLILRDAAGTLRGGLIGKQLWDWLFVEMLWVDEALRGQGWGRRLLRQAEAEAVREGCTRALLDTFEFQARPFYEREGYTVFGELEDFPPGFRRFYMRKELGHAPEGGGEPPMSRSGPRR